MTETSRVGLHQPAPTDLVNVTTDLNDNMDRLDAAVGFENVSDFPAAPFAGKAINFGSYAYFHNGTSPASGGWVQLLTPATFNSNILVASGKYVSVGGGSIFNTSFGATRTTATDSAFAAGVSNDSNPRISIAADGKISWGPGSSTAVDTNLYRSAADTLKTDDSFHVGATLRHLGSSLGFYNATAIAKPTVSGSKAANAALTSLCTALANLGLITNSTT